jgi:hypothetical protein
MKLDREEYESTELYAFHLYNDLGCTDVAFAIANQPVWSKWYTYHELMHKAHEDSIPLYNDSKMSITVAEFWNRCNNRTVLDIEVLLDIDQVFGLSDKESIRVKAEEIMDQLEQCRLTFEAFFSGSKSYHISLLFPELRSMNAFQRKEFKQKLMIRLGSDPMKSSERNMVALEGVKHWKTSNMKVQVR